MGGIGAGAGTSSGGCGSEARRASEWRRWCLEPAIERTQENNIRMIVTIGRPRGNFAKGGFLDHGVEIIDIIWIRLKKF